MPSDQPFVSHLAALLAVYDLGPQLSTSVPHYDGPKDPHTDAILKSISSMAHRMWAAEGALAMHKLHLNKAAIAGQHLHGGPPGDTDAKLDRAYCPDCGTAPANTVGEVDELKLLKTQIQDVARVCDAISKGDFSQKITIPVHEVAMVQLKDVINTMVDKLGQFAMEITRISQEVGTEGKLGGQALVLNFEGTWRELADVVNKLAANLTSQLRSIAIVTKAVAIGDLSKQVEVEAHGEILDLKNTVNGMVIRLRVLATEVTRVTLEVGSQGKLGGQAHVPYAEGVWLNLVRNVNHMSSSLTDQVRSIAHVTKAIARGDLTQKIEFEMKGEMSTLKDTVNSMVDQLSTFASEVTRVLVLEGGTQGTLGGQVKVEGVQGIWADLTRNVNRMASDLTNVTRAIAEVTKAVALGEFNKQIDLDVQGEMLDLKVTVNYMVNHLRTLACEVIRISLDIGTEGILDGQAFVPGAEGMWKILIDNVNLMGKNLSNQVRAITLVTKAVAAGDMTKMIEIDAKGEILELKKTVNGMTSSLSSYAYGVSKVAREVGTEGNLGVRAEAEEFKVSDTRLPYPFI